MYIHTSLSLYIYVCLCLCVYVYMHRCVYIYRDRHTEYMMLTAPSLGFCVLGLCDCRALGPWLRVLPG